MKQIILHLILLCTLIYSSPADAVITFAETSHDSIDMLEDGGSLRMVPRPEGFFNRIALKIEGQEVKFRKEPEYLGTDIVYGVIPLGLNRKTYICFAWDVDHATLYLDHNRNFDLTDEAPASINHGSINPRAQHFDDVVLSLPHKNGTIDYHVSLQLKRPHKTASGYAVINSGWETGIDIGGEKWVIAVCDNLNGIIDDGDICHIMPKRKLNHRFKTRFIGVDRHSIPNSIFINDKNISIGFAFTVDGSGQTKLMLELEQFESPMGTLDIEGKVDRMLLYTKDGKTTNLAILQNPSGETPVPAGKYHMQKYYMGDGSLDATRTQQIEILPNETVPLKIGGPLNNSISVEKRGANLVLKYKLVGVDSTEFRHRYTTSWSGTPQFAIYKNDRKVATGTFRYG